MRLKGWWPTNIGLQGDDYTTKQIINLVHDIIIEKNIRKIGMFNYLVGDVGLFSTFCSSSKDYIYYGNQLIDIRELSGDFLDFISSLLRDSISV